MANKTSRARSGEISLHVEQAGHGEPVLLICGLGYSSWCWTEMRAALAPQFKVITFDNRGTGRSDKPAGPYTMAMLADDAARVLEHCGVTRAHVIGHSMGGYITLTLALRHLEKVSSLTLVSTSPGGPDTQPVPAETQAAWQAAASMPPQDYARASMPRSFSRGWTERNPERFEAILKQRLEFPTPMACWLAQYQACGEYVAQGVDVSQLAVPALVIHGTDDRVVPYYNGQLLASRLPQARLISLPGSGHLPYLEDPAGFAGVLREHLAATHKKS